MKVVLSLIVIALVAFAVALYKVYRLVQKVSLLCDINHCHINFTADRFHLLKDDAIIIWAYILAKENRNLKNNPHLLSIRESKLQEVREWVKEHDKEDESKDIPRCDDK